MRGALAASLLAAWLGITWPGLTACSDQPLADPKTPVRTTPGRVAPEAPGPSTPSTPQPRTPQPRTSAAAPADPAVPARFDAARAFGHVRVLAGRIGPRQATGPAFRAAARYVERRLAAAGYAVRRECFPVPAGDSWGVPVAAGRSCNVVATPPGYDAAAPYLLLGAHLDTVAVAPGAEDNASGVAVLLEAARLAARHGTRLPTVFVAFGAEEPRGPGDLHHFGSRHHVASLAGEELRNLRAMVSLDRVGVGEAVPLSSVAGRDTRVRDRLAGLARTLGIRPMVGVDDASDHESFADVGIDAARIGSTPYAAYHSADDVSAVVQPAQLRRSGRLTWAWLRAD